MTNEELDLFLEGNPQIEWAQDDEGVFYFRHSAFDGEHEKVKVTPKAFASLTPQKLEHILTGGRNIDHITRVTGYFSRVSGWNKGKRGELVERQRVVVS